MIAVLQRVSRAEVRVEDETVGRIEGGFLALVGAVDGDEDGDAEFLAGRIVHLRVFPDEDGKMNRSLLEIGGEVLVVSQFTLAGDTRKGRRPSFIRALHPEFAEPLIERLVSALQRFEVRVATGRFGAQMHVELVNDGPVTLLLDTHETRRGNRREPGAGS